MNVRKEAYVQSAVNTWDFFSRKDPKFVQAVFQPYPNVEDPTGLSGVVHVWMQKMGYNRVPDWRGAGLGFWTETPDIGWARVQPWATAVEIPGIQQLEMQSFTRGTHELVIARPEAKARYMAGAE
ncbi:hypothetical protein A2363_01265 [Candidatus Gottesmanbacteria bacterium RIFOXYB1_FULL_47_11]|uniref:Uncharacterized protein n=1 Tax=Candidatus Gottesmanbacteria bacterium RIFOXYB1_FULL_47_11 TaxID=1798401 RepID=A0A1F6BDW2_9BACT|nr:MAG: hypothetical protein A2363_01265 [Candidatus Gottesmanbacteria bacterium RIFOXYB1_FULL_47_11]